MIFKKTDINLIPEIVNPSPDYYCTWQTQLYATNDGKPLAQRAAIGEKALFDKNKPFGWAYFYEKARQDLLFVMDDSWDVPLNNDTDYYGSLILNKEKFPSFAGNNTNTKALEILVNKIKKIGWKGLGGWVCAQESETVSCKKSVEDYWKERLIEADESGFTYWKVDWGEKCHSIDFRKMLTDLACKYAPNLIIEHAIVSDSIHYSDVFRTYDVPAIMSIPMTMKKIADLVCKMPSESQCLINCEDEVYIAATLGCTMGVMRHPYSGNFCNGKSDMSFPNMHRNLKTKMYEVLRAVRFHRISPAFSVGREQFSVSDLKLTDYWKLENASEEIEEWWFENELISESVKDGGILKTAPSAISRNTSLPEVEQDERGYIPYIVASKNPNGVYSVATLGRTIDREYFIPKCDVKIDIGDCKTLGIFGEYKSLTIKTDIENIKTILVQDLADDKAYDVTDSVKIGNGKIVISWDTISLIGTMSQPEDDTSEPGVVLQIIQ